MLRMLVDPSTAPYADAYTSSRDLTSYARRNWIFIFDTIRLTVRQAQFVNSLAGGLSVLLKLARDSHDPVDVRVQRPSFSPCNLPGHERAKIRSRPLAPACLSVPSV